MLLLKMKIVAILLGLSTSAAREGVHYNVSRAAKDVYSVPGEGFIITKDCTYNAKGQRVRVVRRAYGSYVNFYDDDGQLEAECNLIHR